MSARRIDREAWANVVESLIAGRKKTVFARLVGVSTRTIDRWLAAEVDVSEESVRALARALGWTARELRNVLVRVGYYRDDDFETEPLTAEKIDEVMQIVADDTELTPKLKMAIIKRLLELEEQDRERRKEMAKWLVDRAKEAG